MIGEKEIIKCPMSGCTFQMLKFDWNLLVGDFDCPECGRIPMKYFGKEKIHREQQEKRRKKALITTGEANKKYGGMRN